MKFIITLLVDRWTRWQLNLKQTKKKSFRGIVPVCGRRWRWGDSTAFQNSSCATTQESQVRISLWQGATHLLKWYAFGEQEPGKIKTNEMHSILFITKFQNLMSPKTELPAHWNADCYGRNWNKDTSSLLLQWRDMGGGRRERRRHRNLGKLPTMLFHKVLPTPLTPIFLPIAVYEINLFNSGAVNTMTDVPPNDHR